MITDKDYYLFKETETELLFRIKEIIKESESDISHGLGIKRTRKKLTLNEQVEIVIKEISDRINFYKIEIKEKICNEYAFCKKLSRLRNKQDEINLYSSLVDIIISFFAGIPLPIALIAAYVYKKGYFHKICNCVEK